MSENANFSMEVNLAGVTTASVAMQDPPGGPYEVEIVSVKSQTKDGEGGSGKTSLAFSVVIVEDGPAKGMPVQVFIGTDWSKDFNRKHLKNLLTGIGIPDNALAGNVKINASLFEKRHAFIFVKAPAEGEVDEQGRKKFADKNFMAKPEYTQTKQAFAIAGGMPAPAASRPAASSASNGTPGATGQVPTGPAAGGAVDLSTMFGTQGN